MIRVTATALGLLYVALPSPGFAKEGLAKGGPRTLSDYNIQKEVLVPAPRRRYFNGFTARMSIGSRGARHYLPGATRYPTIRLERAPSN